MAETYEYILAVPNEDLEQVMPIIKQELSIPMFGKTLVDNVFIINVPEDTLDKIVDKIKGILEKHKIKTCFFVDIMNDYRSTCVGMSKFDGKFN